MKAAPHKQLGESWLVNGFRHLAVSLFIFGRNVLISERNRMNWFDKVLDEALRPLLKFAAWAAVVIAVFEEVHYLWSFHILYAGLIIAAAAWLLLIEPLLDIPYIYFVKENGLFLYTKGSQRTAFNYVTLLTDADNRGHGKFIGVNLLNIAKPAPLNESNSYLVFDNNNSATTILPHQRWYGTNPSDAKVVLVKPDGSKARMSIGSFIERQAQILHGAKAA